MFIRSPLYLLWALCLDRYGVLGRYVLVPVAAWSFNLFVCLLISHNEAQPWRELLSPSSLIP